MQEYIEREAAKERLRMWITDCVLAGDNDGADCYRDCIDLLDSIPAALREQMEWISVRDRLPEEKEPVIILLQDGQIFRGEIRNRQSLPEWWYYYDAGDTDTDMLGLLYYAGGTDGMWFRENPVIAWLPLPEPPKEEKR